MTTTETIVVVTTITQGAMSIGILIWKVGRWTRSVEHPERRQHHRDGRLGPEERREFLASRIDALDRRLSGCEAEIREVRAQVTTVARRLGTILSERH